MNYQEYLGLTNIFLKKEIEEGFEETKFYSVNLEKQ